jgi:hypothetical protein
MSRSTPRVVLVAIGVVFGLWETANILTIEVPFFAALFAALFLATSAWCWRRGSLPSVLAVMVLCLFEVAEAPTWADTATQTRVLAIMLGLSGALTGALTLMNRRRHAA